MADVQGRARRVSLAVLDLEGTSVSPGDWVIVHTGFAVRRIEPDDALELLALHRQLTGREVDP